MFYFGSSLACLEYKKADLCLPVKQLTLQTPGEDAEKVFCFEIPDPTKSSQKGKYANCGSTICLIIICLE